jgi:hypothetical protein
MPVAVFDTEYSLVTYDRPTGYALTADEFGMGLGEFLNRQHNIFPDAERTLILSGEVADGFEIPDVNPSPDDPGAAPTEHPALESIRAAGWKVRALTPYMRCYRKFGNRTHVFTIVIFDWMTKSNTPMIMEHSPIMTCMRMVDWAEQTGVQWFANGQFTGGDLFWKIHKDKRRSLQEQNKRRRLENHFPLPWFDEDIRPMLQEGMAGCESPYTKGDFLNPSLPVFEEPTDFKFLTVDARKAYLTAACSVKVAMGKLIPGPVIFDKGLSGFWRVRTAPWPTDNVMPDPAGYGTPLPDGTRWVTSPTLELCEEIGHDFTIYESWVSTGTTGLKAWGEKLRDVLYSEKGTTLEPAVKMAAVQTIGDWARIPENPETKARLCRPDWNAAVIALFRSNLWRKMRDAAHSGIYPAWIETDKVLYPAADEHGIRMTRTQSGRLSFPEGKTFGHFEYDTEFRPWPKLALPTQYDEYMASTADLAYDESDDFDQ